MSRITIIPIDKIAIIDGVAKQPLDYVIDPTIHAIQWYDTWGEIEYISTREGKRQNEQFDDISQFQNVIDSWNNHIVLDPFANTTSNIV
jgi:hypothetical protein